jgi:hypothetical protein
MSRLRTAETVRDGQVIPEADLVRGDPEAAAPFQVREATTVHLGPRGGRMRVRTIGETPAPLEAGPTDPGQSFQVREAVTINLPPPHWATLTKEEELCHAPHSGPDTNSGQD